jgi:RNA polymerase sigma-70 factor (ECF subfamily)
LTSLAGEASRDEVWAAVLGERDRAVRVARRCASPEDVDDCVQEALARVAAMPRIDLDRVGALVTAVTANIAMDGHRGRARLARALDRMRQRPEVPNHADDVCDIEEARWLRAQLTRLSTHERRALQMQADGRTVTEVAAALGVTYKAAEKALGRARRHLRYVWQATAGVMVVVWAGARRSRAAVLPGIAAFAAAAFVMSVTNQPHDADHPATTPDANVSAALTYRVPTPAQRPTSTRPRPAPVIQPAERRAAVHGAIPRHVVATPVVHAKGLVIRRTYVQRRTPGETFAQTVQRCIARGVTVTAGRVGCND